MIKKVGEQFRVRRGVTGFKYDDLPDGLKTVAADR